MFLDIRKISYDSAELFLSANDKTVPVLRDQLFKEVEKLLDQYDENIFYPEEIINWRIAQELSYTINPEDFEDINILNTDHIDLLKLSKKLKLEQADREQITQILLFLGLVENINPYLEQIPVDIYAHIHRHLQHNDISNLARCSKQIKSLIFGKSSRKYLFPHLEIALDYDERTFCSYFNTNLKMQTFSRDFLFAGEIIFYLNKEHKIQIKYHRSNTIEQLHINKKGDIVQIVIINHIIYALFNDGTIISKNSLTKEEMTTIDLKDCIFMSVNKKDLIIVIEDGSCFKWNGYSVKIRGPKYIVQAVDYDSCSKLLLTSNGLLYVCNDDYGECRKFSFGGTTIKGVKQLARDGKHFLDNEGFLHIIELKTWKITFNHNYGKYGKVIKIVDNYDHFYLLNSEGKVYNLFLKDPVFDKVTDLIDHYHDKLFYISDKSLKYRDCLHYLGSIVHNVMTI